MTMEPIYTKYQIAEAWETYQRSHCWRYTKAGGKSAVRMTAPDPNAEQILQCRMVRLKDVISFPKYLEIEYGK